MNPQGTANRFIVFRAVKRLMNELGRCPTAREVADVTGLHWTTCGLHMTALVGSSGLPIKIDHGSGRKSEFMKRENNNVDVTARWLSPPVDKHISSGIIEKWAWGSDE